MVKIMAKSIICEGKTTTEAIKQGLKELNCKEEDVDIRVIEDEDKKAFFSILAPRVVKVELTLKDGKEKKEEKNKTEEKVVEKRIPTKEDFEEFEKATKEFLNEFCKLYGDIDFSLEEKDGLVSIFITGKDASKLIGYRGETINSLQNLISAIGNKNTKIRVKVSVDIEKYRERREESLKSLAMKLEKTVKRTGKKVVLEPMSAYERKIIHVALQNSKYVTTYSIGEEPKRKVVVEKK
jgi:spoIIIJ-associated protein